MDTRAVEELRRLEAQDAALAARAESLEALNAEVAAIRLRAGEIDAFFAGRPAAAERLAAIGGAAADELARRRHQLAEAEGLVEAAKDDEARAAALRALSRAADHVHVAETRVARSAEELESLERETAALPDELHALEARAAQVAAALDDVEPRGELVDWASRAHASLFVAAGQIDAQRERVIREANELATMLLGEPTYGATVAQALTRVTAARTGSRSDP